MKKEKIIGHSVRFFSKFLPPQTLHSLTLRKVFFPCISKEFFYQRLLVYKKLPYRQRKRKIPSLSFKVQDAVVGKEL
jgi:hypothetical protein